MQGSLLFQFRKLMCSVERFGVNKLQSESYEFMSIFAIDSQI